MAITTVRLASYDDDAVVFEMDINGNDRVVALRCVNNDPGGRAAYGEIRRQSDGLKYGARFAAVGTTEIAVPTTAGERVQLARIGTHWDGYDGSFEFPWV